MSIRIVSTMRVILAVVVVLLAAPLALAGSIPESVVLPKPRFPAPATDVTPSGPRLVLVSSRYRDPAALPPERPAPPSWAPRTFEGAALESAVRQRGSSSSSTSGRYVVGATTRTQALRYAYDFSALTRPPNRGEFEPVTWAREVDGVLYVSNSHLTYATATKGRNAYLSAIEIGARKTLWRSPALVANARTFVVTGDLIVAGYGFTAEPDYLYLLDRGPGRCSIGSRCPARPRSSSCAATGCTSERTTASSSCDSAARARSRRRRRASRRAAARRRGRSRARRTGCRPRAPARSP